MTTQEFKEIIENYTRYFVQMQGETDFSDGWKLSIQGRTIEDILELYESLILLLVSTKVFYKFATKKLLDMKHPQQSHKLLTIYLPNGIEPESFAELVNINIANYKGGEGIKPKGYNHYVNSIWYRNDRDENGNYVIPGENNS